MSLRQVYWWVSKFKKKCQTDLKDKQHPGSPRTTSAEALPAEITDAIQAMVN